MRWILFCLVLLAVQTQMVGCAFSEKANAVGRMVVKLKPEAGREIARLKNETGVVRTEQIPIEALRALSQKYQIKEWKPLFAQTTSDDLTGLERIYVLSCDPAVDIGAAAQAFNTLSDLVEYAELDVPVEALKTP